MECTHSTRSSFFLNSLSSFHVNTRNPLSLSLSSSLTNFYSSFLSSYFAWHEIRQTGLREGREKWSSGEWKIECVSLFSDHEPSFFLFFFLFHSFSLISLPLHFFPLSFSILTLFLSSTGSQWIFDDDDPEREVVVHFGQRGWIPGTFNGKWEGVFFRFISFHSSPSSSSSWFLWRKKMWWKLVRREKE